MENFQLHELNAVLLNSILYGYTQIIKSLIEREMHRVRENYFRNEQVYVEQMLVENPIFEQGKYQQQPIDENEIDMNVTATVAKERNTFQQQRAEACRRSRYNNKICEAKLKYRHRYISQKLLENTRIYGNLKHLMARTERQLLRQGFPGDQLLDLRRIYGMKKAIDSMRKLKHTMIMEN